MTEKAEKLGSLFLAVFATGLAAQLASAGMLHGGQWAGAAVASLASITVAVAVRRWPRTAERVRADERA